MALSISRLFLPSTNGNINTRAYNTDMDTLFNVFHGLESQINSLAALKITPRTNSATSLLVTNAAGSTIFAVNTITGTITGTVTGGASLAGDNAFTGLNTFSQDIELITAATGVILKSPGGTRFRVTVANDGSLVTTSL